MRVRGTNPCCVRKGTQGVPDIRVLLCRLIASYRQQGFQRRFHRSSQARCRR